MSGLAIARLVLIGEGLAYLALGLVFLVLPDTGLEWIFQSTAVATQRVELVTFYGGLEVGLGVWLIWSGSAGRTQLRHGAWSALVLQGGLLLGRGVGLAGAGEATIDDRLWVYAAIELLLVSCAAAACYAVWREQDHEGERLAGGR